MFVRDFVYVGQPFEAAAPRFVADASWLAPIAETAAASARTTAARLRELAGVDRPTGLGGPGRIRCHVGPLRARVDSILVALWLFGEPAAGFPDLTGDLEVAPAGTSRTRIALDATYPRPPIERDVLQRHERATEAGVRAFLDGIAAALGGPTGL